MQRFAVMLDALSRWTQPRDLAFSLHNLKHMEERMLRVFACLVLVLVGCARQSESEIETSSDDVFYTGDNQAQYSRGAQAGYGQQSVFVQLADYIYWLNYNVTNVVKLQFSPDPSIITIQQVQNHCWNFDVTSSGTVSIARIDNRPQAGYGTMTETTQNAFNVNWTVENSGRGGVIFVLFGSGYGWDSLRVSGTVQQCSTSGAAQSFDVDLSSYLSSSYLPYFKQQVGGTQLIRGRAVNYQ